MKMSVQPNRKYATHKLTMRDFVLCSNLHRPESRAAPPLSIFPLLVRLPTSVHTILSLLDLVAMAAWLGRHELNDVVEIGYPTAVLVEGEQEAGIFDWGCEGADGVLSQRKRC
jgi:hypothetical protein